MSLRRRILSLINASVVAMSLGCGPRASAAPPPRPSAPIALPEGYYSEAKAKPILEKMLPVRLAPDLSALAPGEAEAVKKLLAAGEIFEAIYERSRHREALSSRRDLEELDRRLGSPAATRGLLTLYQFFQGPIGTTLENKREAFLPAGPSAPGKAVYPWGIAKGEVDAFLAARPGERASILDVRTVVRRADAASAREDLAALKRHPVLETLHPGLRERLEGIEKSPDPRALYAVPYAVAYADEMVQAYLLLMSAAGAAAADDPDFARYLKNRARDLLSNDYESGDASWVTGRFKRLNAQIGAYEVYDDELYGTKAFYSLSVLLRDVKASDDVTRAVGDLQSIEDSLPYENKKRVQAGIPIGVYDVIADFGQARGGNTASILPNEPEFARRYGRRILMRRNILEHPEIDAKIVRPYQAALDPSHAGDYRPDGRFYYTLWHEIGHYLGVDRDKSGRDLDTALEDASSLLEEMKADLVGLFVVKSLAERGFYDEARKRAVYAAGVFRTLQDVRPRRDQPYRTMQLMQMNYFLEKGLLSFDRGRGVLKIHYDRYHDVVTSLLREVLAVQYAGDKAAADRFIDARSRWEKDLHEVLAEKIRKKQTYRFQLMRYAALGQ
jgi:hypothetical protein